MFIDDKTGITKEFQFSLVFYNIKVLTGATVITWFDTHIHFMHARWGTNINVAILQVGYSVGGMEV